MQRITATNFNSTTQLCPLVFSYLSDLLRHTHSYSWTGKSLCGGFPTALSNWSQRCWPKAIQASPAPISDYRNLALIRIKDFVERNLGDFDLDPTAVAAALKFFSRYINQLLETEGTSLSRYIWRRRLEMAASDLENNGLDSLSISTIALNNGFNDLSHFNKAFRERFGELPRNYRRKKNQAS